MRAGYLLTLPDAEVAERQQRPGDGGSVAVECPPILLRGLIGSRSVQIARPHSEWARGGPDGCSLMFKSNPPPKATQLRECNDPAQTSDAGRLQPFRRNATVSS